jgi:hypothetical protein
MLFEGYFKLKIGSQKVPRRFINLHFCPSPYHKSQICRILNQYAIFMSSLN